MGADASKETLKNEIEALESKIADLKKKKEGFRNISEIEREARIAQKL